MKNTTRGLIHALIVSVTMLCTIASTGRAMLAPAQGARDADVKAVQAALESKIVGERLKALGLSEKEIDSRLAKLSDEQVHKLAKDIDALSSGGDVGGILVLVILVLLIVFLVHRI